MKKLESFEFEEINAVESKQHNGGSWIGEAIGFGLGYLVSRHNNAPAIAMDIGRWMAKK